MSRVCLTFDNGPHPAGTPHVLDVLAKHGLRSTFFVLGKNLERDEDIALAKAARDAGHRLGNHTYSHEIPLGVDPRPDAVTLELERTHLRLAEIWDGARIFRPFGGGGELGPHLLSPAAVEWLARREYSCALWTSVPGDFTDPHGWVERGLAQVEGEEDAVVVLHDCEPEAMAHLDTFVRALLDRGHTLTDEIPQACLPILDGAPQVDLTPYIGAPRT